MAVGDPATAGQPDVPLSQDTRFEMQNTLNRTVGGKMDLGGFLRALCQKLDADTGVNDTDFVSLFTPDP